MKTRASRFLRSLPLQVAILALLALALAPRVGLAFGPGPVAAAWAQAQARGAYSFSADVTQVTVPAATAANVGRSSRSDRLLLSGRADLRAKRLDLRLWSDGGSLAAPGSGLELRVAGGKTEARQGGGAWRELPGATDAIAPQGDMLAYLAAVRDVRELGRDERAGRSFTRYAFTLDGPRLAGHLRDQLERQLRAAGELPPGARLEAADSYARAEGEGELWIDADGLPLRQILELRFPEQGGERVGARIVVDFSQYSQAYGLPVAPGELGAALLALAAGLALMAGLIAFARSRRLAVALAAALIASTVAGPLLGSLRMRGFLDAQAAQAAERADTAAESDMAQALRRLSAGQAFDPHADPLAAPAAPQAVAPQAVAPQAVANPGGDDDGDGLTNAAEAALGTSSSAADADSDGVPDGRDSDGDLVPDNIEVAGFSLAGRTWRGDPLQRDSNGDGVGDTQEWLGDADGDGLPDDSDGDGTPDLFDRDNDNDGVPDRMDLSPQRVARPGDAASLFTEQAPLRISLRSLAQGELSLLDLQLRPASEDQLWFSQSVLDWPLDRRGQIQDGDGFTFADLARAEGRVPDVTEANGDLKLLPMLEIRAPADSGFPEQAVLTPYNLSSSANPDGSRLLYAPLSVVSDQETGARVAFNARLPYVADATGLEVRLVWAVQMLSDICAESSGGECVRYDSLNTPTVIQVYYEPWLLTGATLREDHGASIAAIYEDPEAPEETDLREDETLWLLSHGLDSSFLGGRDADGDGQPDLDLAEIARRFDRLGNGGVGEVQRWGLPNSLRVETKSYASFDEAIITTAMTTTKELLGRAFSPRWSASDPQPIKPLILFAREERFRVQSLDSAGDGYVGLAGAELSFDMAPGGRPAAPLLRQHGLSWSAFCAQAGAGGAADWSTCPSDEYWQELERRYDGKMAQPGDTPDMAAGRLILAQLYFLSLAQGVSRIVASDGAIQAPGFTPLADNDTLSLVRSVRNGAAAAVSGLLNVAIMAGYVDKISLLEYLGRLLKEFRGGTLAQGVAGIGRALIDKIGFKAGITVIGIAVVAVVAALAVGAYFLVKHYLAGELAAKIVVSALITGISLLLSVILPIITVVQWVGALQAAGIGTLSALRTVLSASSSLVGTSQAASVVGAIVAALVVWGFFIYAMVTSKTTPFSPEFNRAFAEAIAATIFVIILAVLSATVVGLIIVGVIALIDGILTAVCELGVDDLRKVPGLGGACFTLGTASTKVIAKLLYSFDVMVDVERSDLIVTGSPDVRLADPNRGFVAGNPLSVQLPVTTTVVHKSPKPEDWMHIVPYLWLFSEDNLRRSTFSYSLTPAAQAQGAELDAMPGAWTIVRDRLFGATIGSAEFGKTMFRGQAVSAHAPLDGINLAPGLNRRLDFNLNIGYAVPAYECWTIPNPIIPFIPPAIPICYTRDVKGSSSAPISDQVQLDILPDTLAGFRALVSDGNGGFKLGWDLAFTSIVDADGDGLRARAHGGLDPDDATWDADGDGLSDVLEIERRQAGLSISPVSFDSDGDGLTDAQELEFGTHPVQADSDGDGLTDAEERLHPVYRLDVAQRRAVPTGAWAGGWEVSVPGLAFPITVSGDPTQADPDGDGVTDQAERQLALAASAADRLDGDGAPFHPRVFNRSPVSVFVAASDPDLLVRPGESLVYTTTVLGESALLAGGGLEVSSASPALPGLLRSFPLDFSAGQPIVSAAPLSVAAGAASGEARLDSLVKARLQGTGGPEQSWRPAQLGTLGSFTDKSLSWTAVAPAEPGRQDSYLLAGQAVGAQNFGSSLPLHDPLRKGDVPAFALPGGQTLNVEADGADTAALLGSTGSRVACDEAGNCMVVWSRYQNCGTVTINSFSISVPGESNGADIAIYLRRNANFLRPGESQHTYVADAVDVGRGGTIAINRSFSFCGDAALEVYEFDNITLNQFAPPTGTIFRLSDAQLFLTLQGTNDVTFSGSTPDGTVAGSINRNIPVQSMRQIAGGVVGPEGDVRAPTRSLSAPNGTDAEDWAPAVATDGFGFLVAWERTNTVFANIGDDQAESRVVVRRYDSSGNARGAELVLPLEQSLAVSSYAPRPNLALDAAWVGDAYRVVWALSNGTLRAADFSAQGALIDGPRTLATGASDPRIAYDPASGRTLVVYRSGASQIVALLLTSRADAGTPRTLTSDGLGHHLAYHPTARAWLVGWSDLASGTNNQLYRLVNPDGTTRDSLTPPTVTWPAAPPNLRGNSLACPAVNSVPAVELSLEEFPGATSFADSSGNGGAGSCADGSCPTAGVAGAGARVSPQSDFAVAFDGAGQSLSFSPGASAPQPGALSVAFWFRTAQAGGSPDLHWNEGAGVVSGQRFGFGLSGGRLAFGTRPGESARSGSVADGEWHFATATVSAGQSQLYIDGVAVGSVRGETLPAGPLSLALGRQLAGGGFFSGVIDQLQIFPTTLSPAAVRALFERTNQSYCVAASAGGSTFRTALLRLDRNDTRGGLITQAGGLTLRIDGDAPGSSVSAPADGASIAAPGGAATLIVGGSAQDPTSEVALVEVSVNGGPFVAANGAASWSFAAVLSPGRNTIVSRATDAAGNVETPGPGVTVLVDEAAPAAGIEPAQTAGPLVPARLADGGWALSLGGTIGDPQSGGQPGSGVDPQSLSLTLQPATAAAGAAQGAGGQPAALGGGGWQASYRFPEGTPDPSGVYTATLRAADLAGNVATVEARVSVDAAGPALGLAERLIPVTVITDTVAISGGAADPAGVTAAEARLLPIEQVAPLADAAMLLALDEPAGAVFFADRTAARNDAACVAAPCPTAGETGRVDGAARFTAATALRTAGAYSLGADESLTLAAWVRVAGPTAGALIGGEGAGGEPERRFGLLLDQGRPALAVGGERLTGGRALGADQWHHVAAVIDRGAGRAALFLDGGLVGEGALGPAGPLGGAPLRIGGFEGLLDEPTLIRGALNAAQVAALPAAADTPWRPAALAGAPGAQTWSLQLPEGLEGQYQLDLRATDALGNLGFAGNLWRVIIDTTAPRLALGTEASGRSFVNEQGETRHEVAYNYSARDRHLDDARLSGPCDAVPERSFADLAALGDLFGDLTVRDGLSVSCTRWEPAGAQPPSVSACDLYGRCASERFNGGQPLAAAVAGLAQAGAPQATITSPTAGTVVVAGEGGSFQVSVAAEAAAGLEQVVIELDGAPLATVDLSGGQPLTRAVRTVTLRAAEGEHTLTARATDRTGATQGESAQVRFSLDTAAPGASLDESQLGADDILAPGSGMLQLSGTATDTLGLAAVLLRIDDGAYGEVTLRPDGSWSTTRWFGWDVEGQRYSVTLRVIDRAGRTTEVTRGVEVVAPSVQELETAISAGPQLATAERSASFRFSGVAPAGRSVAGFRCQLNDGPVTPCASPQSYSGLAPGQQLFQVYAVDDQGDTDGTPAFYSWVVEGEQRLYLPLVVR